MQVMVDAVAYKKICEENIDSLPLFYTPWWLDTVWGKGQWLPYIIMVDKSVKAIFPLCVKKKIGIKAIVMPPLTPYLAMWLIDTGDSLHYNTYLSACLHHLPSTWITAMSPHYAFNDSTSWTSIGFHLSVKNTYTIYNQPYTQVYQKYPNTMKRDLRRASEKMYIQEQSQIDDLYKMIGYTYAVQKIPIPVSYKLVNDIAQNPALNPKIYSAIADGSVVASIMTLSDKKWTYYILSGRSQDAPHGTIAVLIDYAIKTTLEQGRSFDFEGSSIESIATFFRSFSPDHHQYPHAIKYKNSLVKYLLTHKMV